MELPSRSRCASCSRRNRTSSCRLVTCERSRSISCASARLLVEDCTGIGSEKASSAAGRRKRPRPPRKPSCCGGCDSLSRREDTKAAADDALGVSDSTGTAMCRWGLEEAKGSHMEPAPPPMYSGLGAGIDGGGVAVPGKSIEPLAGNVYVRTLLSTGGDTARTTTPAFAGTTTVPPEPYGCGEPRGIGIGGVTEPRSGA
mmetsp:Transcript_35444/g.100742  ORF Transcript_35444/g.100742 Transcript_35444/m.100742 type:complete len:200 (+) Transcript_35444:555-1154(+)